jgi:CheY-like chemotaxis protein
MDPIPFPGGLPTFIDRSRNLEPAAGRVQDRTEDDSRADILIVDDRPDKLLVYETILEDLGRLFTAESGQQALKQVLERDFAVILLDVNMPSMDGLETAALVRNRSRSAHVPIIFITADYNDEQHMARGYALGASITSVRRSFRRSCAPRSRSCRPLLLARQAGSRRRACRACRAGGAAAAEQATHRLAFLAQASVTLAARSTPGHRARAGAAVRPRGRGRLRTHARRRDARRGDR